MKLAELEKSAKFDTKITRSSDGSWFYMHVYHPPAFSATGSGVTLVLTPHQIRALAVLFNHEVKKMDEERA